MAGFLTLCLLTSFLGEKELWIDGDCTAKGESEMMMNCYFLQLPTFSPLPTGSTCLLLSVFPRFKTLLALTLQNCKNMEFRVSQHETCVIIIIMKNFVVRNHIPSPSFHLCGIKTEGKAINNLRQNKIYCVY